MTLHTNCGIVVWFQVQEFEIIHLLKATLYDLVTLCASF